MDGVSNLQLSDNGYGPLVLCTYDADNLPFNRLRNHREAGEPATTLWELWNSDEAGPGMNSRNHIMFGGNGVWLAHMWQVSTTPPVLSASNT